MPNSLLSTPARRWATGATVATVVVGAAVAGPLIAGADSELPDRTAAELLVDLASLDVQPFAGTVVQSADVGLPELANSDTTSLPTAALSLLNGSSTARIWYTDGDTYRFALQDDQAESDLIRNGQDLWFWSSEGASASHLVLPEDTGDDATGGPFGGDNPFGGEGMEGLPEDLPADVPTAAASLALAMIEPSTQVDVDGTATVAGRHAYELVLRPKDEQSLIGSIRLAVDGETSMPLRVQFVARDASEPSFEVGFTSISFDEPDASTYEFAPPPGTTVDEIQPDELDDAAAQHHPGAGAGHEGMDQSDVSVVGSGWSSVFVLRGVDLDQLTAGLDGDAAAMADAFLADFQDVSGPYGTGRAMTSDLFTVLLLDDGRLLMGAVPLEVLEQAAQDPAAAL
ncbi:LolA family protein [Jiangella endophytica]|uniref:LolA family protein n=1 Tax=Jiangella endophytica TaxID=1623398 RepID=UPI000E344900|nr:sigma-E factor regulatory protein RseB domain-containing protein [Jiangella endophytica]